MNESTEQRALTAFTPALKATVVCIAMFLPPLAEQARGVAYARKGQLGQARAALALADAGAAKVIQARRS